MKKLLAAILTLSLLMSLVLCGASAEDGYADYTCKEQNFSTKIPLSGTSGYDKDNAGLTIYTDVPGYIPYVIVRRRPMDMKFSNPENYLNNVYREYIEEKYGDNNLGMNPAKAWEIGGKELLGARYMYKLGDYTVVHLQLIEVRPDGDVEYTVKYIDGEGDATLAAAEEAVRYYQETDISILPVEGTAEPGGDSGGTGAPAFMTPVVFADYFNNMMIVLADQYAEALGEEGVTIVKENYTLTQEDQQGPLVYYGNNDWSVEAGFLFADEVDYYAGSPALTLNFSYKNSLPDGAVYLVKTALTMVIAYHYQEEVSLNELSAWFESANDPSDVFQLPGYTLNVIVSDEYTQYAVLLPADENPYLAGGE
jgi:hypothetical protein